MRTRMTGLLAIAALTMTIGLGSKARAAEIIFEMPQNVFNQQTFSLTNGGYTLLFTSTRAGGFIDLTDPDYGGVVVGDSSIGTFSIQKTAGPQHLIFKSYEIGATFFFSAGTKTFNLTGGTGTSNGNAFPATDPSPNPVSFNFNGPYLLESGQTVLFSLVNFNPGPPLPDQAIFHSITFTPVPEPSTYALGGIGSLTLAWLARRRRAKS